MTFRPQKKKKKTDHSFDVNKRIVYTMRSCGQGYSGVTTLCTLMDKPMTANNYDKLVKRFSKVSQEVTEETMMDCANEIRAKGKALESGDDNDNNGIVDTAISQNGTWQRRGHSSLSGCMTAISMETGKILDVVVVCSQCLDIAKDVR